MSLRLACSVTHGHISNFTLQVTAQKIQFVFVSLPFSAISIKWEWLTSKINGCFQTPKTNGVDSKNRKLIVQECPWKLCVSLTLSHSVLNPLSSIYTLLLTAWRIISCCLCNDVYVKFLQSHLSGPKLEPEYSNIHNTQMLHCNLEKLFSHKGAEWQPGRQRPWRVFTPQETWSARHSLSVKVLTTKTKTDKGVVMEIN